MRTTKGNSLLETRRINRALIKNLIFRNENITRIDIANTLSLTLPTITTTINDMLNEGILEEIPLNGTINGAGRRPNAIAFRAEMAYSIGVELGPYFCSIAVLNMKGQTLSKKIIKSPNEKYKVMLDEICRNISDIILPYPKNKILGVGIGLPGFIKYSQGIIKNNPRKDWNLKPLAKDVEEKIGIKTIIDNNVRIRAIGFELSKVQVTDKPLAYLYTSKGVACPIIARYGIISGNNSGAGELGETVIQVNAKSFEHKVVDELASERAIFESCQKYLLDNKLKSLKAIIKEKSFYTIDDIIRLQKAGDSEINEIIENTIKYLGIALSNVVNLINPKFVVVDAYIMSLEKNREYLIKNSHKFFFGLNEEEVNFIFQPYDEFWGAKAAALFVISNLYLDA